jgi:starch synthase (maltosyl-transferring)
MIIYNLFPLLAGEVGGWTPHLARAAEMGFDWIFVNPVQQPGCSGSLYSIKDYFDFNPLIVAGADPKERASRFRRVIAEAEELGLKLMMDLVVNHCAIDSALTKEHKNWFQLEGGQVAHPWCLQDQKKVVWEDLAQFDHQTGSDPEGLYQYLFKVVEFLAGLGVKGFRCDAAYQVPEAFWRRMIGETRKRHPDVLFLAETLGCSPSETTRTAQAGFDYIFNSSKWWDFSGPWLIEQYNFTRELAKSVSFPESHDTARVAQETNGNGDGLKQRYFFSALFSAGVMMPIGFEFGFRKPLHVVNTRPADWEKTGLDLTAYIKAMNRTKADNPIFQEDAPTDILGADNPNILLMRKGSWRARQQALLILNKDISSKQHFHAPNLHDYVQATGPLTDVSPEYPLDYVPAPFEYGLRPGQGIVLVSGKSK